MKLKRILRIAIAEFVLVIPMVFVQGQQMTAAEIIKKAEDKFMGEKTSQGIMTIKIIRPAWQRNITAKSWSKGKNFSLTLITAPAREKGQSFLKRYNELWNWNPTISRMIKLPPSMMSQGWMGSDYSNDDILRETSILDDYNQKLLGEENAQGYACYKIELIPHEDAAVVWGKIITWISKDEFFQMKAEYYDEDGYLIRTMLSSDIKIFDDRKLPSIMEIIPEEEEGRKTVVILESLKFNDPIADSFFSQQNMKRVR
jgi:outer membrane lipoprotein-sorting protein